MRESDIENHLIRELKKIGVKTRKCKWIGYDGAPDRLIFAMGGIFVELKAPGKKPRANQVLEHEHMRAGGLRVEVIDSIDMVNALVKQIEYFNAKRIHPPRLPVKNHETPA